MTAHHDGAPSVDDRTPIYVRDVIFQPDHNKVVRFITSLFSLQTCDEGHSWKYVTEDQRQWYWDEFVKKYCWPEHLDGTIRQIWYKNVATQYRRTIHSWRTADHHPLTVTAGRWAAWTAAWHEEGWMNRAAKNKENRYSEPVGIGTGITKHIAGSKTYSAHGHSLRERHGRDPTSWELYVHTHRHDDGSFVDERSRIVHQAMENYMDESLTPLDDGSIPDHPSPEEVNSMFKTVVGGPKKGRMYGCGSMASTIYPDEMAPRRRGRSSSSSRGSQETEKMREQWETQKKVNELLRTDLEATQTILHETRKENSSLNDRMSLLEDQVRMLVAGLPQGPPLHTQPSTTGRVLFGRSSSCRGRYVAESSRGDPFAAGPSHHRTSGKVLRYSQEYVPSSQDFGHEDDDDDDNGGDGDDDDDGKTQPH